MKTILKIVENKNVEKRTHINNGNYSVRIVDETRTYYTENDKVFIETKEFNKEINEYEIINTEDATEYYKVVNNELFERYSDYRTKNDMKVFSCNVDRKLSSEFEKKLIDLKLSKTEWLTKKMNEELNK